MLKQRLLTAIILAPLALAGLFALDGAAFALFTGAVICVAAWEWSRLSGLPQAGQIIYPLAVGLALLGAWGQPHLLYQALWAAALFWSFALVLVFTYPKTVHWWRCPSRRALMGLFVLLPAWSGFVLLRDLGAFWLLYVLLIAWVADIFAYFTGRALGKNKLAPAVSPGKSWEGVAGGLVGTIFLSLATSLYLDLAALHSLILLLTTLVITAISVLGDLTESLIKRESGMKDSSNLLPGHGGFMDRIDSLTSAVPIFALLMIDLGGGML
jgi:phosphatidate cytidylyltransferase